MRDEDTGIMVRKKKLWKKLKTTAMWQREYEISSPAANRQHHHQKHFKDDEQSSTGSARQEVLKTMANNRKKSTLRERKLMIIHNKNNKFREISSQWNRDKWIQQSDFCDFSSICLPTRLLCWHTLVFFRFGTNGRILFSLIPLRNYHLILLRWFYISHPLKLSTHIEVKA